MLFFPALIMPLAAHLDIPMEKTIGLGFFMFLLFGITALPWGILGDKFGARPLLAIFYGGAGLCGLWAAWAIQQKDLWQITLSLGGIGLFSGIYHPVGLGWIGKQITSKTARAMALNGIFGNLGLTCGPVVAGLINWLITAPAAYVFLGLINLSSLGLLAQSRNQINQSEQKISKPEQTPPIRGFIVLLFAMMISGFIYRGVTVTMPPLFEMRTEHIYSFVHTLIPAIDSKNLLATAVVSFIFMFGMLAQYVGGRVGEKIDLRYGYLLFHTLTIPFALISAQLTDIPLIFAILMHSFFLLGMQPMENTLVARLTPPTLHSSAFGMKFILTFGIGALSVPMVKYISMHKGIEYVYPTLALISLLLVSVIFVLIKVTKSVRS